MLQHTIARVAPKVERSESHRNVMPRGLGMSYAVALRVGVLLALSRAEHTSALKTQIIVRRVATHETPGSTFFFCFEENLL